MNVPLRLPWRTSGPRKVRGRCGQFPGVTPLRILFGALLLMAGCSTPESEIEPSPTAFPGETLWTDSAGKVQPRDVIVSSIGPEHCDWTTVTFLTVGGLPGRGGTQYLRDPEARIPTRLLATTYAVGVELPAAARDTGFRLDGAALWVSPNAAYVITAAEVERWPKSLGFGVACL